MPNWLLMMYCPSSGTVKYQIALVFGCGFAGAVIPIPNAIE